MSSDDVDDSKVVENVYVPPKTASIIKDLSVGSGPSIFDEAHMSYDSTSNDVNELIMSNIPAMPSKSILFSYPEYAFMVVPSESYFSESPEFFARIQEMVCSVSSFTDHLEFTFESDFSLAKLDVCHPRHPMYLILPSLGVMHRVPTALHLHVAHIDDITRSIAICNNTYKFAAYTYSILQEFVVDSKSP